MLFRLSDEVDADRLTSAIEKAMKAHPGLFAQIISDENGMPAMRYQRTYAEQEICVREQMTEEKFLQEKTSLVQPFSLQNERLFRIRLIKTEKAHHLFMDFHHIIFDGISMQVLFSDLYKAFRGEPVDPETWTAFDAAFAGQKARQGELWKKAKNWFLTHFGTADTGDLPEGDRKDKTIRIADRTFTLGLTYGKLRDFCKRSKINRSVFTTAAFGYLLSSYSMKNEALFSTVYTGRRDPRTQRTVSMFVTTLPVLCRRDRKMLVTDYLTDLKEQLQGAMDNDLYSFAELAAETGITSDVQFVWQAGLLSLPMEPGLKLTKEELPFIKTGNTMSAELYTEDDRLIFHIQYHTDRYSEAYITRFAACFDHVLQEMMVKDKLTDVFLLCDQEKQKLLSISKSETLAYDTKETWLDLFLDHVRQTPDKTAVTDCKGSYTYAELDQVSNSIAACLLSNGVKENDFVAVKMGRVKEFPAAVIGIQKAGAAYLPIDPEYPEERIEYMLEDSEAKAVLMEETVSHALSEYPDAGPVNLASPSHRAYMIYTSGSTGKPKGVVQSHRSLRAFTAWRLKELEIGPDSVHAAHASFSFDASLDDLICPLAAGGEVHILSDELRRNMSGMRDYFLKHHVTALTMSTQLGMAMVNQYPDMDLMYVMMGGEKMLPCSKTGIKLINGYGPTEFTVCSSLHMVDQAKDMDTVEIGHFKLDALIDRAHLFGTMRNSSVTMNALWNAAFGLTLSGFLFRSDSVHMMVYNGRNDPRLQSCVGMFVHTFPVVCSADPDESGMDFAGRIGKQISESMSHDIYSFPEISKEFGIKADILFVYQGNMGEDLAIGGKKAEMIPVDLDTVKASLTIFVFEKEDGFHIQCDYDSRHYEEWSIRALLEGMVNVFRCLIQNRKIGEISLVYRRRVPDQLQHERFHAVSGGL